MDTGSGAVHVTDDVVFDVLPVAEQTLKRLQGENAGADGTAFFSPEDAPLQGKAARDALREAVCSDLTLRRRYDRKTLDEALEDIFTLIETEQLFTEDVYESAISAFTARETVVKALCLNVAHDCNLRCSYCFADEGEYRGRRGMMSAEVGKAALDFLVRSSGNRRNLEVDFFGGEPLMNFPVVKELVAYGRELEQKHDKRFRFTLTTNGVLLTDEILAFCNREMGNLVLSIDGRREIHDRMRPFADGTGSYDRIVKKLRKAAESRGQKNYFVRGTFTRHNLDFAKDVLHLADLGFEQISVEPVVAQPSDDYALRMEDVPLLCEQYDRLAQEMLKRRAEGRPFNFFHFNIDLEGGPCVYKRLSGCGAGCEYLGVTPWGELYPCHQFVGDPDFIIGDVWKGVDQEDITGQFKQCNVYSRKECRDCFAKLYCSGGCAANAYHFDGKITGVYDVGCALQKKRIECAIMLKAALSEEEEIRKEEAR